MIFSPKTALFIFLICFPIISTAQYSIGIKGGSGFSQVNFQPARRINSLNKHSFGLSFKYLPPPQKNYKRDLRAGISVELNYTGRGWEEFFISTDSVFRKDINYIELPFLSHFSLGKKRFRFIINMGPVISYGINGTEKYEREKKEYSIKNYNYPSDKDNKFDFALCGGIGCCFDADIGSIELQARYNHSLTNVIDVEAIDRAAWAQNQYINISLAYYFNFGKYWNERKLRLKESTVLN